MRLRPDVAQVFRDYPRIYLACHRKHVRDPETGTPVSANQVGIMDHLDTATPTMLSDLAAHMGVTPATMSIAVGRLVDLGFVTRVLDPVDRRKVQLRLTEAGARVCAANSVLEPTLVEEMLDQLAERDRKAALRGLELLAKGAVSAQHARTKAAAAARKGRKTA
jgi:MarR family transcriptional regulator, organic hydroperoxide resistance regulator